MNPNTIQTSRAITLTWELSEGPMSFGVSIHRSISGSTNQSLARNTTIAATKEYPTVCFHETGGVSPKSAKVARREL